MQFFTAKGVKVILWGAGLFSAFLFSSNPPNSHSGAPSESQCSNCHAGGNYTGNISITGVPDEVVPNTTYNLVFTINSTGGGNPSVGGFQMTVLDESDTFTGTLTASNSDVGVDFASGLSRYYAEHRGDKSFGGGTSVNWNFSWTSPASAPGAGGLTFYYNAILANNNGGSSGDAVVGGSKSITLGADPLPVDWLYFRVSQNAEKHQLEWATASEDLNRGFGVEHSLDGKDWEVISFIDGVGSSSEINTYQYLHQPLQEGMHYYRLKQEDFSGRVSYSNVEEIRWISKEGDLFYPNPTKGLIYVSLNEGSQVSIFSIAGQNMGSYKVINGEVDLSNLGKGVYLLVYQKGSNRKTKKINILP